MLLSSFGRLAILVITEAFQLCVTDFSACTSLGFLKEIEL
jgi:hypothetical protein